MQLQKTSQRGEEIVLHENVQRVGTRVLWLDKPYFSISKCLHQNHFRKQASIHPNWIKYAGGVELTDIPHTNSV